MPDRRAFVEQLILALWIEVKPLDYVESSAEKFQLTISITLCPKRRRVSMKSIH